MFRSINGGTTWTRAPTSDGRTSWASRRSARAGTIVWPLAGDGGVIISRDGGDVVVGAGRRSAAVSGPSPRCPAAASLPIGANGFVAVG